MAGLRELEMTMANDALPGAPDPRGVTAVDGTAKARIEDMDLPKIELDSLTDRKKLNAQLKKARARFEELRENMNFRSAA